MGLLKNRNSVLNRPGLESYKSICPPSFQKNARITRIKISPRNFIHGGPLVSYKTCKLTYMLICLNHVKIEKNNNNNISKEEQASFQANHVKITAICRGVTIGLKQKVIKLIPRTRQKKPENHYYSIGRHVPVKPRKESIPIPGSNTHTTNRNGSVTDQTLHRLDLPMSRKQDGFQSPSCTACFTLALNVLIT